MRGLGLNGPQLQDIKNGSDKSYFACMLLLLSHISTLTSACFLAWKVPGCTSSIRWLEYYVQIIQTVPLYNNMQCYAYVTYDDKLHKSASSFSKR